MKDIVIMEEDDVVVLEFNDEYDGENLIYHEKMRKKIKNKKLNTRIRAIVKENEKLKYYTNILLNMCGIRNDKHIIKSVSFIQAHVRGWILRCDKKEFDKSVEMFLRQCRIFLAKKEVENRRNSIIKIQSVMRGVLQRKTPIGKGISAILELKKDILRCEISLLLASRFKN